MLTWTPTPEIIAGSNLHAVMTEAGFADLAAFHAWSVAQPAKFWALILDWLVLPFAVPTEPILDDAKVVESPVWLPGAEINIADACFNHPEDAFVLVEGRESEKRCHSSCEFLLRYSDSIATGLQARGFQPGDAIAILGPMTATTVAAYLGIVLAGMTVVSIPESFAAPEIARRLRISRAKFAIAQDALVRNGKVIPLTDKLPADMPAAVFGGQIVAPTLRPVDILFSDFTVNARHNFQPVPCHPAAPTNILFSSGTTGDPKAIPWTHTTPIKAAADGFLYFDLKPGDVLCWPSSLGWMMGPWAIYAALVNGATLALFDGHPGSKEFCKFVETAGVTVLGVVPSLVRSWIGTGAWDGCDWSKIRLFGSTGECSNPEAMSALMEKAGSKPVIEYCGGTEIGGGYLTSTLLRPNIPSTFNQVAFGLAIDIRDEAGQPASRGEVFLRGPSIGLSTTLLNADHHAVYYADTPEPGLRRHGDDLEALPDGYYRMHGRADDAMNLGGIKVSAVEIERVLNRHPGVSESAAVAMEDESGGPAKLVVFVVATAGADFKTLPAELQNLLRDDLNPLYKIAEVRRIEALPRTASNKVLRRELRKTLATAR